MPTIQLNTFIDANQLTCFDTSRSIDVHTNSMFSSNEKAVAGRTTGLIQLHETVTWCAKHFGIWWTLTSRITQINVPYSFTDEMVRGPFARMHHKHIFLKENKGTLMIDEFTYTSPLSIFGKIADWLFVKKYMRRLLSSRNQFIKAYAETHHNSI